MNCKRCGHRLWGVRSRECPGCHAPFKPSEFRFRPKTVRFCCPRCEQGYLGAGEGGLPEPHRFECIACGSWVHIDQMHLEIADGVDEEDTRADANPWLELHRPVWMRWCLTAVRGAVTPRALVRLTPPDVGPRAPVRFLLLSHGVFAMAGLAAGPGLGLCLSLPRGAGAFGVLSVRGVALLVVLLLVSVGFAGLWVLVAHAVVRRARPEATRARTLQAICFTCTPQGLWFLPGAGLYVGWVGTVLWAVAGARALAQAQGISSRRAALAAALLPSGCALVFAAAVGVWATGVLGPADSRMRWAAPGAEAVGVFAGPLREASAQGRRLTHGAELLSDGRLAASSFLAPGSRTTMADVELAGVTLGGFEEASPARRLAIIQQAARALPAGAFAHRVGDYVFVFDALAHGADTPGLWVVIEAWDPGVNAAAGQAIRVLRADWTIRAIPAGLRAHALDEQNRLRATKGLPALGNPHALRAEEPAIVPGG
jgi:hypothetical protein